MDDPLTDQPTRRSTIPFVVWLLVAAALAHLAVSIAPDWYRLFGPYLLVDLGMVIGWTRAVSPFLLAATVILGADRWPAGRRWLLLGAGGLAAVGLFALGLDVWLALWEPSPGDASNGISVLLMGRAIAAAIAFVAAYALLAAGLWAARHASLGSGSRRTLISVIGVAGLVALVAGLWAVSLWLEVAAPPPTMSGYVTFGVLTALGAPAMAALAIAAVRTKPARGGLPETLIAAGAIGAMGGITWEFVLPSAVGGLDFSADIPGWFFTVPAALIALGMLAMVAGFGLGAVAAGAGRGRDAGDPSA
jgi:hypothetical protein